MMRKLLFVFFGMILLSACADAPAPQTSVACAEGQPPEVCRKNQEQGKTLETLETGCLRMLEKPAARILAERDGSPCSRLSAEVDKNKESRSPSRMTLVGSYRGKIAEAHENNCRVALTTSVEPNQADKIWTACSGLTWLIGMNPNLNTPSRQELLTQSGIKVMARSMKGPNVSQGAAEKAAGELIGKCKATCAEHEKACAAGKPTDAVCFKLAACMCGCAVENLPANHPDVAKLKHCVADSTARASRLQVPPNN